MIPYDTETLHSLLRHYNETIWPAQIVAVLLGLGLVALPFANHRHDATARIAAVLLATAWAWTGAVYEWSYYATLNWAGMFHAALFALQALALLWFGVWRGRLRIGFVRRFPVAVGLALAVGAVVVYPAIDRLTGTGWPDARFAGLMSDPTALATLGVLLISRPRAPVALWIVPLFWAFFTGWWGWLLGSGDWFVGPAAGVLTLAILMVPKWRPAGV